MKTVEGQKVIIISKDEINNKTYTVISLEALDAAAARLNNTSYKLWTYLAKNQDKYKFALSQVAFCNWGSVSKPTYLKAVQDLIEKGYLVQKAEGSNIYIFYELPKTETFPETNEDLEIEPAKVKKFNF